MANVELVTRTRLRDLAKLKGDSMQTHLAKIRSDAAECLLLSTLATDDRSKMFATMAEHLNDLASEVEKGIAANPPKLTKGDLAAGPIIIPQVGEAQNLEVADSPRAADRPRRIWPWLVIPLAALVAGSALWGLHPNWLNSARASARQDSANAVPANAVPAPKEAEQSDRQEIYNRLSAAEARVEAVAGELERLRNSQALLTSPVDETPRRNGRHHQHRSVRHARSGGSMFGF